MSIGMTMNIPRALAQAVTQLQGDTKRLDAEVLLCHVLRHDRVYLHSHREHELTAAQQACFAELLRRRAAGEPVAYLVGEKEFWSMRLEVSPETLIPRPETELLVSEALRRLPDDAAGTVADLGTGSGAVALALASERPHLQVVATDASAAALAVARRNARRHGITNIEFRQGDWLAALANERYAMIVSNPPYIPVDDPHLRQGDVRCEPQQALAAGDDGLAALRAIGAGARAHLEPQGMLLLEHGFDQDTAVKRLLTGLGYIRITLQRDLAGLPRVTSACWPGG
jgi:release factor glutamine methyltransferase